MSDPSRPKAPASAPRSAGTSADAPRPAGTPATTVAKPKRRGDTVRLVGGIALGALVMLFALLNLDDVEVNWILGTWSTPLILVIAVSLVFGAAADRLLVMRGGRKSRKG